MRFFYRLTADAGHWLAECEELETFGRGETPIQALEQLRAVIAERLDRPYAVAPPEDAEPIAIDLVPQDEAFDLGQLDEYELAR